LPCWYSWAQGVGSNGILPPPLYSVAGGQPNKDAKFDLWAVPQDEIGTYDAAVPTLSSNGSAIDGILIMEPTRKTILLHLRRFKHLFKNHGLLRCQLYILETIRYSW
jgi:hypothetical protein